MRKLHIDIETFSKVNLRSAGLYRYAEKCEVLLIAYAYNLNPVGIVDLTKERIPEDLKAALTDPEIVKISHNAPFERACLSSYLGIELPPDQWRCALVRGAVAGLPLSLDQAAQALGCDNAKDASGKALIKYFCVPCPGTKANGGRTRNYPHHDVEKWERFKKYCKQDVEVERENYEELSFVKITPFEQRLWEIDQIINETGVLIDEKFARNAIAMDKDFRARLVEEAVRITGIPNPNSVTQLRAWLEEESGDEFEDLRKASIPKFIDRSDDRKVRRVLTIRKELSKTSVKKYAAMLSAVCDDGRVRGLLQFYGANRTGRWAGRLVQIQNLPRGIYHGISLDYARKMVLEGNAEELEMLFGAVSDTLSQLIRTAIVAEKGKRLIVADFSAIEARVIAWLAGESWRLDVFNTHGKIYEASASQMFKVPLESVTKGSDYRAKAKIAELALGYQGGVNALLNMGAIAMGLREDELQEIVDVWRAANPKIKAYWNDIGKAAITSIKTGAEVTVRNIVFKYAGGHLQIKLPSGRWIYYFRASVIKGDYGDIIQYHGMDQTSKKWTRIKTYGGKLVENIVQATARDCLAQAIVNVHEAGYRIVMHVHDEIVVEEKIGKGSLEDVVRLMVKPAPWMRGLPLGAEGYEGTYYKKD